MINNEDRRKSVESIELREGEKKIKSHSTGSIECVLSRTNRKKAKLANIKAFPRLLRSDIFQLIDIFIRRFESLLLGSVLFTRHIRSPRDRKKREKKHLTDIT